jgi:hypothetical protein
MVICEGPSGCKRYLPDMAKDLVRIPRCICNLNTPAAKSLRSKDAKGARKTAAMIAKENKISTLHAKPHSRRDHDGHPETMTGPTLAEA